MTPSAAPSAAPASALQKLFELSRDLLGVAGMDGYFRHVNPAFERVLGYTETELRSRPFIELVHPEDRDATLAEIEKLRSGETTLRFENRYRCKDGTYRWLAWTSVPNEEDGLLYAVARDVTERKQSLDHLLNDLPGMVYRCRNDEDWTMKFVSGGCAELTGYRPEDLLERGGVKYASIIHADDRKRIWDEVQLAIRDHREFQFEYRIRTADGREKCVWERGRPLRDDDGEVYALQGFVADITERRRLRNELIQLQKMESLGQLTGGIAHDFNNLLAVVIGNLELLEEQIEGAPPDRELLADALEAAWRGAELSRRLLAFARRQMLAPKPVSVLELLASMRSLLGRTIGAAIDIEMELPEQLPMVFVDAGQLENAILNLAINARDAMPNGGTLSIRAQRFKVDEEYVATRPEASLGRHVAIEVADTGTGMSTEVQEHVFEPFFTTKEPGKGTGLGLSMVYGFLKQSGGHARIYSEPGYGTSVKLYLPEAEDSALTSTVETLALKPDGAAGTAQILVVEDDPKVRRAAVQRLSRLGYRTLEAQSGQEGLDVLRAQPDAVDLLFTDVVMRGGMSGIELAERALAEYPGLKVLLTSGFSAQHAAGGSPFPLLTKPYRKSQLARAIQRTLAPETSSQEP